MRFQQVNILAVIGVLQVVNAQFSANTDLAKIYFYYGPSLVDQTVFNLSDIASLLRHPRFRPEATTSMYVHGYEESTDVFSVQLPVTSSSANGGFNTLVLDWGPLAKGLYSTAVENMVQVGNRMAIVLLSLFNAGLSVDKFYLVGHSLGGQMAGIIGNGVQVTSGHSTKLIRITALDPAGPLFWKIGDIPIFFRQITPQDASFVDVIHTDAGFLGLPTSCGTVDFWPNSGTRPQPGCSIIDITAAALGQACDHQRSWRYWSDSLGQMADPTAFSAVEAKDYDSFKAGQVIGSRIVSMGINCPKNVTGNWFLQTASQIPYSLGTSGATYQVQMQNINFF